MIVETVTTTINPDGSVNCAAMGVEWGEATIVIKPYRATRTLRNRHGVPLLRRTIDSTLTVVHTDVATTRAIRGDINCQATLAFDDTWSAHRTTCFKIPFFASQAGSSAEKRL